MNKSVYHCIPRSNRTTGPVKLSRYAGILILFMLATSLVRAQPMKYLSSSVSLARIQQGDQHLQGWKLTIQTSGTFDPVSLTGIEFSREKKYRTVVKKDLRVYYTGKDSVFSADRPVGSMKAKDRHSSVQGEQTLEEGKNYFWIVFAGNLIGQKPEPPAPVISFDLGRQVYEQVWSDEFNGDTINRSNWKFEKGFVRNRENQWYQEENAHVGGGWLTIEARKEKKPNPLYVAGSSDWRKSRPDIEYTSSCLLTAGKQSWLYGRFEMKGRIDTVSGYWPAWWTLGIEKRWPSNGEIDIMEFYRGMLLANIAVGTAKPSTALWFSKRFAVTELGEQWHRQFHSWVMDWDEEAISLYLDGRLLNRQLQSNLLNRDSSGFAPFRQPQYMLLNLAIGGDNGGDPGRSAFPRKFEIDFVRVSQKIKGRYLSMGTFIPGTNQTLSNKKNRRL